MHLNLYLLPGTATDASSCEIAERKGRGHPDSVCDALAETLSIGLSRFYLERFGAILHHNVDKALLVGGAARPAFGGGELLQPIEITLAGRATREFGGVRVPVDELAIELSREWLRRNVRYLEPERGVRIVSRIRETSPDLAALFLRQGDRSTPLANDTSFGTGYAPLDRLERAVLAADKALSAPEALVAHPEIGNDIKVLGVRMHEQVEITVACAFVGRHVRDLQDYFAKKERVRSLVASATEAKVAVNAADGATAESVYLTVTGLSAESGDDGQVGRGNRVNGLITPYRPMSLEAAAGKNPLTHTGKVYNLLAHRIAQALVAEVPGVEEAYCTLLSRIGSPITEPQLADIGVRLSEPRRLDSVRNSIAQLVRAHLDGAPLLWREVLAGRCPIA